MQRLLVVLLALLSLPASAQEAFEEEEERLKFGFEVKGHWRDSDSVRFPSPFPFPMQALPLGQPRGLMETVEAGSHAEVSVVTLFLDSRWRDDWSARVKLDLIDRYDRNPTSEDDEFDLDEAWIRWGQETEPGRIPEELGFYVKLGKFPKFERQDDRHLESYGLISTAFNRFEDAGVEIGADLNRRLYFKVSFTQGNPLFYRDPNALAGDHGIPLLDGSVLNPDPELKTGFPIFYDADIEDLDFSNHETGFGLGLRFGEDTGMAVVDVLVWRYERTLADTVDLTGTFYGGDLDILRGPFSDPVPDPDFALAITDNDKVEVGANIWAYVGDFTLFAQYVDQDLAGLSREGWETEISWSYEMPFLGSAFGRQVLPYIQPAFRFSRLEPNITGGPQFPAPSVRWEWDKIDVGLRLGVLDRLLDLTVEWNLNEFIRLGEKEEADEFLATVRWRMDWRR